MPHKDPITETLRDARIKQGLSVLELAEILKIPAERIYKWDQGKSAPKFEDRAKVDQWLAGKNFQPNRVKLAQAGDSPALDQADNATLLRILDNLSAAHREISESNNKLADNEKFILMKLPTAGSHGESPSDEYATLQGVRGLLIEFYADVKKTTLQEAESVLGTKVVAAKKKVGKKDILSDAGK